MLSSKQLKDIAAEARPIIERQLDDAEVIAGFRKLVADNGGDWSALKGLLKAQIQDERDGDGDGAGNRVKRIVEKAEFASAYADMLGLANMNEKNFSAEQFPPHDSETGEIHDTQDQSETATGSGRTAQVCGEGMAPPLPAGAADAVRSTPAASVSDAIARKDHQSVSPSSPDGSASTESAAGKVSGPAQPSPPKQAEPIKAGEGVPALSPAILSDEEVVPAFLRKSAEPVINERCERPTDCKYAHHPNKVTCSTCSTAWAIAQKKAAA